MKVYLVWLEVFDKNGYHSELDAVCATKEDAHNHIREFDAMALQRYLETIGHNMSYYEVADPMYTAYIDNDSILQLEYYNHIIVRFNIDERNMKENA